MRQRPASSEHSSGHEPQNSNMADNYGAAAGGADAGDGTQGGAASKKLLAAAAHGAPRTGARAPEHGDRAFALASSG